MSVGEEEVLELEKNKTKKEQGSGSRSSPGKQICIPEAEIFVCFGVECELGEH